MRIYDYRYKISYKKDEPTGHVGYYYEAEQIKKDEAPYLVKKYEDGPFATFDWAEKGARTLIKRLDDEAKLDDWIFYNPDLNAK